MADEVKLDGDWKGLAARLKALPDRIRENLERATKQNAVGLKGAIQEGIISQAPGGQKFAPLHPFTVAQRLAGMSPNHRGVVVRRADGRFARMGDDDTGHKALMNHGDLLGAIAFVVFEDGLSARVGVQRKANHEGDDLVNIAKILTEGRVIEVTSRMRGWLHANGLHLSPMTTHIVIPPRPFIAPVYEAYKPIIRQRYLDAQQAAIESLRSG